MKDFAVIVKKGPWLNQTLACVQFDKFGAKLDHKIFICDQWHDGLELAKSQGYLRGLFVNSGTIIPDWTQFYTLLMNYPHQGLIAHLIWHEHSRLHLDEQCWYMDLDRFTITDLTASTVCHPVPIRSKQNLHDDYTPLWVKSGNQQMIEYEVDGFGQGLIARQLCSLSSIVNWNNHMRDLKCFYYSGQPMAVADKFAEYIDLSEKQFWVLNNEPITASKKPRILMPGSGLAWILEMIQPTVDLVQIVDISKTQLNFCQNLWNDWDGIDYGSVCWDFIERFQLKNYELDQADLSALQKLQFKKKSYFVDHVNQCFNKLMPENFASLWATAKKNKQLRLANDNLVTWVLNNDIDLFDSIWCSNILGYKWTLLHTTPEQIDRFNQKLREHAQRN